MIGLPIWREARGRLKKHKLANNGVDWFFWGGERHCTFSIYVAPCLGTGLGTTKSTKTARVPSEATPGKRDIVFDFISHNPKVVGSNPTPATIVRWELFRQRLPFLFANSRREPRSERSCSIQVNTPTLDRACESRSQHD